MNDENNNNNTVENKNATSVLVKRKATSDTIHQKPQSVPSVKSLSAMSINRLLSTLSTPPSVLSAGTIINIDVGECWDETYNLFREFGESTLLINPHYMERYSEHEINADIRAFLFDVIMNIATDMELHHQTLMLALHIVDRYLSTKAPLPEKCQLLQIGAAATLIACKHEESVAGAEDLLSEILLWIPPDTIDRVDVIPLI